MIGFGGTLVLVSNEFTINSGSKSWYSFLVVLAAFCYAINVNLIKYKLEGISALAIALGNFIAILFPAIIILIFSNFPLQEVFTGKKVSISMGYVFILAFFGTALAKVMFNDLVAISSPVFSISITYLLPIVAILWGVLDNEIFTFIQWIGCAFILLGVYLVTENKRFKKKNTLNDYLIHLQKNYMKFLLSLIFTLYISNSLAQKKYDVILKSIENNGSKYENVANQIWSFAEVGYQGRKK